MGLTFQSPRPSHWELQPGEINLYYVPLTASSTCIENFAQSLASDERDRANRFRTTKLQDAFIIARGTLRAILGQCLNLAPAAVPMDYGEYGKPRIAGNHPLRFNLSHSNGRAFYALSLDREVGVDLEQIRPMPDCDQIARLFFSEEEVRDLRSLPPEQKVVSFFACWTRKEAYIKACGEGFSLALDCFRVSLLPAEPPRLEAPADPRVWSLFDVSPDPGYAAALVAEGIAPALRAWLFNDAEDCANYFQ